MKKNQVISGVVIIVVIAACIGAYFYWRNHDEKPLPKTPDTSSEQTSKDLNNTSGKGSDAPQVKDGITATQAGNIAVQQYGGTVKNVEADTYNSQPVWEVEITDSPQGRIEVKVGQSKGDVLDMEKEDGAS